MFSRLILLVRNLIIIYMIIDKEKMIRSQKGIVAQYGGFIFTFKIAGFLLHSPSAIRAYIFMVYSPQDKELKLTEFELEIIFVSDI